MTDHRPEDQLVVETALVVPVPEAEPAVAGLRARLDPAAALGVPAHVTVISPFVPPDLIDAEVLTALAETVGAVGVFDATFAAVSWFGESVVWLTPEPAASFRRLTEAVWQRFPEFPPYSGVHADVVPHLTVGTGQPVEVLREAEHLVEPKLPVRSRITKAILMQGSMQAGSWRIVAEFPLGTSDNPSKLTTMVR